MTTAKWILCVAASAATSLVSLSSGAAETADDLPTRTVRAWDLDLTRPADAQTLYTRVQAAAKALCNEEAKDHYRQTKRRAPLGWMDSCVTEAVDTAVRNTGDPVLAALHIQLGVAQRD
jgi:UrcA family protein